MLSVPTITSISPSSPASATAPRPPGPSAPVACASSTTTSAPWRRATLDDRLERRDVAVHREHRVGDDHRARAAALAQAPLEVLDVAVAVDEDLGAREPAAVDDRGVVERVGEDRRARRRPARRARRCSRGSRSRTARTPRVPSNSASRALELARGSSSCRRPGARRRRRRPSASPRRRPPRARAGAPRSRGSCSSTAAATGRAVERHARALRAVDQARAPVEPAVAQAPRGDRRSRSIARAPRRARLER